MQDRRMGQREKHLPQTESPGVWYNKIGSVNSNSRHTTILWGRFANAYNKGYDNVHHGEKGGNAWLKYFQMKSLG
jgi:hypothetical protein